MEQLPMGKVTDTVNIRNIKPYNDYLHCSLVMGANAICSTFEVLVLVPVYGTCTHINTIQLYSARDIALKI